MQAHEICDAAKRSQETWKPLSCSKLMKPGSSCTCPMPSLTPACSSTQVPCVALTSHPLCTTSSVIPLTTSTTPYPLPQHLQKIVFPPDCHPYVPNKDAPRALHVPMYFCSSTPHLLSLLLLVPINFSLLPLPTTLPSQQLRPYPLQNQTQRVAPAPVVPRPPKVVIRRRLRQPPVPRRN